jgi:hypothetical protein
LAQETDRHSALVISLWSKGSWAALREEVNIDLREYQWFRAKLEAEYDSAWRFLILAPELREAIAADMEGRPRRNTGIPPTRSERLQIDIDTGSAILDGKQFTDIDPKGLMALRTVADSKGDIKTVDARTKIGCHHDRTFQRWLDRLPSQLRDCVVGVSGRGLRLVLPPVVSVS